MGIATLNQTHITEKITVKQKYRNQIKVPCLYKITAQNSLGCCGVPSRPHTKNGIGKDSDGKKCFHTCIQFYMQSMYTFIQNVLNKNVIEPVLYTKKGYNMYQGQNEINAFQG